jgi:hypothetical protein
MRKKQNGTLLIAACVVAAIRLREAIHEHLTPETKRELKQVGWTNEISETKLWSSVRLCNLVAQSQGSAQRRIPAGGGKGADRTGFRALGADLLQSVQKPDRGDRAGTRDCGNNARQRQIARLLSRDDLCGFPGRREPGQRPTGGVVAFSFTFLSVPPGEQRHAFVQLLNGKTQ